MNNELISVVVPCYNVEKYLEKCVQSIVDQTYKNLEIILVDDGATDGTPKLCDNLAQTDSRINVIHKVNGGLSDARNAGIEVAKGKYITFFDSDDWVEKDILKTAVEKMTNNNTDLVVWGYTAEFVDDDEKVLSSRNCAVSGICELGANNDILIQKDTLGLSGYAWNKLYKTEIIKDNNLIFEKGISLVEDILFSALYFSRCNKIEFIDCIGNHYIQRKRATLGTKRYENVFELKLMGCTARENILKHFQIDDRSISKIMGSFYYGALNAAVTTVATEPNINHADLIEKMNAFLVDKHTQSVAKKAMKTSLKQRLIVMLVRLKAATMLVKMKK
ncbi:MAG: glycosyltransferase family 2 protein [Oscillospiraceae bacterium]|nr:glycosyltransferase family 2 protein [Oscillospiraceae bacterium]